MKQFLLPIISSIPAPISLIVANRLPIPGCWVTIQSMQIYPFWAPRPPERDRRRDGGFDKQLDNWGGLAGVIWTSDDKRTSATIGGTYGQTATKEPWIMYSVVLQHRVTPRTHLVVHHTHGWASKINLGEQDKEYRMV